MAVHTAASLDLYLSTGLPWALPGPAWGNYTLSRDALGAWEAARACAANASSLATISSILSNLEEVLEQSSDVLQVCAGWARGRGAQRPRGTSLDEPCTRLHNRVVGVGLAPSAQGSGVQGVVGTEGGGQGACQVGTLARGLTVELGKGYIADLASARRLRHFSAGCVAHALAVLAAPGSGGVRHGGQLHLPVDPGSVGRLPQPGGAAHCGADHPGRRRRRRQVGRVRQRQLRKLCLGAGAAAGAAGGAVRPAVAVRVHAVRGAAGGAGGDAGARRMM